MKTKYMTIVLVLLMLIGMTMSMFAETAMAQEKRIAVVTALTQAKDIEQETRTWVKTIQGEF